jgi:hypothetical protein
MTFIISNASGLRSSSQGLFNLKTAMIKRKKLPDQSVLISLFYYYDGNLYWSCTRNGFVKQGDIAGSKCNKRYKTVNINKKHYLLHRVIYKYFYNDEPENVDHINGDINDNHILNLQPITTSFNLLKDNKVYKNNTSGYRGVQFRNEVNKWRVRITVNKKRIDVGYFVNKSDAIDARIKAENKYLKSIKR